MADKSNNYKMPIKYLYKYVSVFGTKQIYGALIAGNSILYLYKYYT